MALGRLKMLKSDSFLKETATTWDDEFKMLLEAATKTVQLFTGRQLELAYYEDEFYTGADTNRLWLKEHPVDVVVRVDLWDGLDSYDEESEDYYTVINNRYIQYPALGQESNSTWTKWKSAYQNGIRITYYAGYHTTNWKVADIDIDFDVPRELEYAVCVIAQLMWMEGKKGGARRGISSMSVGIESITVEKYVNELPKDIIKILGHYRRLSV